MTATQKRDAQIQILSFSLPCIEAAWLSASNDVRLRKEAVEVVF